MGIYRNDEFGRLQDLTDYEESERLAAKVAASFTAAITSEAFARIAQALSEPSYSMRDRQLLVDHLLLFCEHAALKYQTLVHMPLENDSDDYD